MVHILRNNGIHLSKTGSLILDFPVYPFSMLHIYMSKHRKRLEREIDELFGDN